MSVVTDYPDYSPHVAQAEQIAATGVPLLTKSSRLYQQAFPNVGGGQTASTNLLSVTQVGYEVIVSAGFGSLATLPYVEVQLTWTDSTTGFTAATDSFTVPGGQSPALLTVNGRGPTKADELTVTMTNLDPSVTASLSIVVLQNSRVYGDDDWRLQNSTANGVTVPGITLAHLPDDESVLGVLTLAAIPASGSGNWLFGMGGPGWCNLAGNLNTIAPASIALTVLAEVTTTYGGGCYALREVLTGPSFTYQFKAPRSILRVSATNSSTVGGTWSLMVTRSG